ncbi:pyrokinin-1 receptor-like isoform X1 [Rhodnius prolixus]|uniref:pyrokinin-1 receptor-like isoform X1 n=1 Tax=Rhodnius prolixus TaxID=13249 RepID=UPI003D18BF1B
MESINVSEYLTLAENSTVATINLSARHNPWGAKRDPLFIVIPMTVLYSLIFLTGVIGNVSTCIVIARNRHMHTATNYYLFSLAISDLLLLISGLPQEMYQLWSKYPYVFGQALCVLLGLAAETSSNATVLTITAFTVERYVAICHPFFSHTVSKLSRAIKFVIAIWIMAILCATPQAMQFGLIYATDRRGNLIDPDEFNMCGLKEHYPYSFEVSTFLFFFAPMSAITILYILIGVRLRKSTSRKAGQRLRDSRRSHGQAKSTTRVVKMLVVVVVAFFICWAPFQTQRLYALYFSPSGNTSPRTILIYKFITYASGLLYYLSTTINPFLYNIMSLKFREAFKNTLTKCLNGREVLQSEGGGGSSGGVGAGGVFPRFNYSVLSHRSVRHNNSTNNSLNNNNSCSSSNSYIDPVDLNRRPLVVSFRKKNTRTSSLEFSGNSPEKRELLQVPRMETFMPGAPKSPSAQTRTAIIRTISTKYSPVRIKSGKQNGIQKIPRIEDIEIFQESQLKILQTKHAQHHQQQQQQQHYHRHHHHHHNYHHQSHHKEMENDDENHSCSVHSDDKQHTSCVDENDEDHVNYVKKSFTVPCLMMN